MLVSARFLIFRLKSYVGNTNTLLYRKMLSVRSPYFWKSWNSLLLVSLDTK